MSEWGWVFLGWSATGGVIALYASRLIVRGRRLSRSVPEHRRRDGQCRDGGSAWPRSP